LDFVGWNGRLMIPGALFEGKPFSGPMGGRQILIKKSPKGRHFFQTVSVRIDSFQTG